MTTYVPPHKRPGATTAEDAPVKTAPIKAAGIVIFRRTDTDVQAVDFLLVQSASGGKGWTPPKGITQPGESDFDAAVRETREETALEKGRDYVFTLGDAPLSYTPAYKDRKHGNNRDKTTVYFIAEATRDAQVGVQSRQVPMLAMQLVAWQLARHTGTCKPCN